MGDESNSDSYEGFQPEVDALDRFERVIDTQIETLQGIDDKAAHITQLVTVLLGVLLTGLTLAWRVENIPLRSLSLFSMGIFYVGVLSLVASLLAGIVTYLTNRYQYGIHRHVPHVLRRYRTTAPQYVELLQRSYAFAIERNKRAMETSVRRFEWSLSFLLFGISSILLGVVLLVNDFGASGWFLALLFGLSLVAPLLKYAVESVLYSRRQEN